MRLDNTPPVNASLFMPNAPVYISKFIHAKEIQIERIQGVSVRQM